MRRNLGAMVEFGIIGNPLGHSRSQEYFNARFQSEHIPAVYRNFPLDKLDGFRDWVASRPDLQGLNVTFPYKEQVMPFLDWISPEAAAIGAVNLIRIEHGAEGFFLKGYNTDCLGFRQDFRDWMSALKIDMTGLKALVLGTGGASKAVRTALQSMGIPFRLVSRDASKGIPYGLLDAELMRECRLIVNATPLGMSPMDDKCPSIPYEFVSSRHLLYDVVYRPSETLFMQKGLAAGAKVRNGMGMWQAQALENWQLFSISNL